MGLDGVELVMQVEEEFGITISDADAEKMSTPRNVADYVMSKLNTAKSAAGANGCLSQKGFYRVRAALVKSFGAVRATVRPDSPIQPFLQGDVKKRWRELQVEIGADYLPDLECGKTAYYLLTLVMPATGALLLIWGSIWGGYSYPVWLSLLAFAVLWVIGLIIAQTIADIVPKELASVGALAPYAGIGNPDEWNYDYILHRVIQITSVHTAVPVGEILPDHHFIKDLGLD